MRGTSFRVVIWYLAMLLHVEMVVNDVWLRGNYTHRGVLRELGLRHPGHVDGPESNLMIILSGEIQDLSTHKIINHNMIL